MVFIEKVCNACYTYVDIHQTGNKSKYICEKHTKL